MDPYIGEIRIFAGNFAPYNWAFCHGQLLAIQQYSTLFSILGTQYGGDGKTTFALPNLKDRAPMHQGNGAGLTPRTVGEEEGNPTVMLSLNQLPAHAHLPQAVNETGTSNNPKGAVWAQAPQQGKFIKKDTPLYHGTANTTMNILSLTPGGNGLPHNNRQPYLGVNFIICLNGEYPSRG
ncbi:tail fiber protein [Brevibacillus choshinensis]|uniref:phage tail protein n=1 Tax=Brevibacillus choshinensis TaxID=54911 RepID=UPI002E1E3109|nr:tail fiber protein [Brevibacillus choshinensis]